jgi:hypothetical protein
MDVAAAGEGLDAFRGAMSPKITSSLPAREQNCMSTTAQMFGMAMGMALMRAFSEELGEGKTVTLHAPITGLPGKTEDTRPASDRTLELRFVLHGAKEDAGER